MIIVMKMSPQPLSLEIYALLHIVNVESVADNSSIVN